MILHCSILTVKHLLSLEPRTQAAFSQPLVGGGTLAMGKADEIFHEVQGSCKTGLAQLGSCKQEIYLFCSLSLPCCTCNT